MIGDLIVISSVVLAAAFWIAWLMRRDMREQVERPKHQFQDRVHQHDQRCRHDSAIGENKGHAHEQ